MSVSFVDTNILIYAHDRDAGDRHLRAKAMVSELWATRSGMLSTQVLHEFYVNVTQKIPAPLEPVRARALIETYLVWDVQTLAPESVLLASEIQQRNAISWWDALIVHAASKGGASVLYTEDLNSGQVIEGVKVVNPFINSAVHDAPDGSL
jgi:predicted nucleic acid-binding protein